MIDPALGFPMFIAFLIGVFAAVLLAYYASGAMDRDIQNRFSRIVRKKTRADKRIDPMDDFFEQLKEARKLEEAARQSCRDVPVTVTDVFDAQLEYNLQKLQEASVDGIEYASQIDGSLEEQLQQVLAKHPSIPVPYPEHEIITSKTRLRGPEE